MDEFATAAIICGCAHMQVAPAGGGDIPEGFAAVTQDGVTVTQDGEPVYVPE